MNIMQNHAKAASNYFIQLKYYSKYNIKYFTLYQCLHLA